MKKDIHPKQTSVSATCTTCNTAYSFTSNKNEIKVDICAACHPFYTGDRSIAKSTGQVERFRQKYAARSSK